MLLQVGGHGSRPTFFEMVAAQQLPNSLRAAITYSLGVLALRRPILHKVLDYEDECFALFMLVLEAHSLRIADASFSESLYGLRRRPVKFKVVESASKAENSGLEKRQKILSVVFLVVLPYLKSKLQSVYNKEREAALRDSLWGDDDERIRDSENTDLESDGAPPSNRIRKTIAACYPWIHAGREGLSFTYQLLYLLDATGFYSMGLHLLGIHVCRATRQELMDASSKTLKERTHERKRLRGPLWVKEIQGAFLSGVYAVLDYAQIGLVASVFFFKMMEWWYQSVEERLMAPTVYPPPPPPPPSKAALDGLALPSDRTTCPLCLQRRVHPSVVTVSGFVFCYTCIFKYVSQYGHCPVTLLPSSVEDIRRLFQDV